MRLEEKPGDSQRHAGAGERRGLFTPAVGTVGAPAGLCRAWVASNTTGAIFFIKSIPSMSTTKLL